VPLFLYYLEALRSSAVRAPEKRGIGKAWRGAKTDNHGLSLEGVKASSLGPRGLKLHPMMKGTVEVGVKKGGRIIPVDPSRSISLFGSLFAAPGNPCSNTSMCNGHVDPYFTLSTHNPGDPETPGSM
jgi:hypothetical protein